MQLSLFDHVQNAYAGTDELLTNAALYDHVAASAGLTPDQLEAREPIGESGTPRSPIKREIRWHQQTLKQAGLIRRRDRGKWELTEHGKTKLHKSRPGTTLVAFSTDLGVALWSLSDEVFPSLDTPITLCLTSPPYPLKNPRAYGNPRLDEYIDWIVASLEPISANLRDGGSICLNLSNDIFEHRSPARSLYRERLVLALAERLGLAKMDELIWHNPCKPPGPVQYASKTRQQLNATYEVVYWFTNNPESVEADNRRVLEPHTERHKALMARGGARAATHSDGAHRRRDGSYGSQTQGRIPRNILRYPHNCPSQSAYKRQAGELGLPAHGAPYPLALAIFLIRFLSRKGDLVVDPFAGSLTTGLGAEQTGRPWVTTECMWEYNRAGLARYQEYPGFQVNHNFIQSVPLPRAA